MQRSPKDISRKVSNPFYVNAIATLMVGFLKGTPLVENAWLQWLQDSTVCLALITLVAAIVGYQSSDQSEL